METNYFKEIISKYIILNYLNNILQEKNSFLEC